MGRVPPSPAVLEAFGLTLTASPTRSREVWRVGSAALKRVDHPAAVEWFCELLTKLDPPSDFRIPAPIAAVDGRWIVDEWVASTWISGTEDGSRWYDILDTGSRFHEWLSDIERPAWIDQVDDPWRASDRMAWDEQSIAVRSEFTPLVDQLTSLRRPIAATSQLVHGDLTGNVLFSDGLAPGIIDLSLYWRPPGYGAAIVAVDCFEWEGVGPEVLNRVAALPEGEQLLIRAALFRIIRASMVPWANTEDRLKIHQRTASALQSRPA
ncbi:MAG: TIGR02569 family protein [Acidimicrobiia bacterium]|nr:TIGR02569 family protein [Acidimicrobiia bacterium]